MIEGPADLPLIVAPSGLLVLSWVTSIGICAEVKVPARWSHPPLVGPYPLNVRCRWCHFLALRVQRGRHARLPAADRHFASVGRGFIEQRVVVGRMPSRMVMPPEKVLAEDERAGAGLDNVAPCPAESLGKGAVSRVVDGR